MQLKTKHLSAVSETYDGSQLVPLWIYLKHQIQGPACVSWVGPCQVTQDLMLDGEDLLAKAEIRGGEMLHFIAELFDTPLVTAVCFQRLFASIVAEVVTQLNPKVILKRQGDDLYFGNKKLSISIAAPAVRSSLVHFAINVTNQGTPVPTCALADFLIDPQTLAQDVLSKVANEWNDIVLATWKVREVKEC